MEVIVGPVASDSARAWVAYARDALVAVVTEPGEDGPWLPDDTVAAFNGYLDEWETVAGQSSTFKWTGTIGTDEGEYLSHAFFRVANALQQAAEARGSAAAPAEAEPFYRALVSGFLDALDQAGPGTSEFSEHLRSFWPGFGD